MLAQVMLKVPSAIHHNAVGLAKMAMDVQNNAGVRQSIGKSWSGWMALSTGGNEEIDKAIEHTWLGHQ